MTYKEFLDTFKRFGAIKGTVAVLGFAIVTGGPAYLFGFSNGKNIQLSQHSETNVNVASAASAFQSATGALNGQSDICPEEKFQGNEADWILREYSGPDAKGFYCPKITSGFTSPEMWLKNPLPLNFKSLELAFEVRDSQPGNGKVAPFVFSLGEDPHILRFFIAEVDPQLVGLAKIDLSSKENGLVREQPGNLRDPIKEGTEVALSVRPVIVKGNNARFLFNVSYISDQTNDPTDDDFTYEVKLPVPDPEEATARFGIGTFKGSCIKPIRYTICN